MNTIAAGCKMPPDVELCKKCLRNMKSTNYVVFKPKIEAHNIHYTCDGYINKNTKGLFDEQGMS